MSLDSIEITSLQMKFQDLLTLIDNAINSGKSIRIYKSVLNQRNNNAKFILWVRKLNLIQLDIIERAFKRIDKITSRARKIEITLQLKALENSVSDIAKRFKVKTSTVQGYFKTLNKYNSDYLNVLALVLKLKGISNDTKLVDFPKFPIRQSINKTKSAISSSDFKNVEEVIKNNIWIKTVVGKNLGTSDISIKLPKK